MGESRTKNVSRNIISGFTYRILMLLMSFVVRTIFIQALGIEYLGLNSLFGSIMSVLNLAELGFGSALVVSMYKPFAEQDVDKINALMNLYRRVYRRIGLTVLFIGLLLIPWLKMLVSDIENIEINIYYVYLINLSSTVVGYFMFAYKACILDVAQRKDIYNLVRMVLMVIQYTVQIALLVVYKNYYLYILIVPIIGMTSNVITAVIVTKQYPEYYCTGQVDKEEQKDIAKKIFGLSLSKISIVLCDGLDNIIISMNLGLLALGIYNSYYYIVAALNSIAYMIVTSITSSVGNYMAQYDENKNYELFNTMSFIWMWFNGWVAITLLCLYQPFMVMWQGEDVLASFVEMSCFCIYYYVVQMGFVVVIFKDACGLWWEDKWRTIIVGLVNLSLNITLVRIWGVVGVLLSTIIATAMISYPWQGLVVFKRYFKKKMIYYQLEQFVYAILVFVVGGITYSICMKFDSYTVINFLIKIAICLTIPNIFFTLLLFKKKEFNSSVIFIKYRVFKNRR